MIYYILTVLCFIGIFIAFYIYFLRNYYSSVSLIEFRELRHDAVLFLSNNINGEIPLKELEEHQMFLENVDATIRHFDKVKNKFSRYKPVRKIYSNIIFSSDQYRKINDEHNASLDEYKIRFYNALKTLFKTIPFYKERLILHLVIIILSLLTKMGFYALKNTLKRAERLYSIEKDLMRNNQCFN